MNDAQMDAVWWLWTYQQYAIVPIAIAMTLGAFALLSLACYAVPTPGHPRRRLWLRLGVGGIAAAVISAVVAVPVPVASCRVAAADPTILQALFKPWQKKPPEMQLWDIQRACAGEAVVIGDPWAGRSPRS